MPFVLLMFFVRTRDLHSLFDDFAQAIMPPLRKRKLHSKITESEFRELAEYLTRTFMLKSQTVTEMLDHIKTPKEHRKKTKKMQAKSTTKYQQAAFSTLECVPFIMVALASFMME
jgi:hypothetical protein